MKRLNLGPKVKFKKAKLPTKKKLFGKYIILEPLKVTKHSKDKKNTFKKIHDDSINTWILMEACNESAKLNKKISLKSFKNSLLGKN